MTPEMATDLIQRALSMILTVAGPMLLAALVVGIGASLLQAVTQVQEQSLTFIPKLVVIGVVFLFTLPWIMHMLVDFTVGMLQTLPMVAR
ncbi:MAG TPA: flagellar biosynthesis protein FliQ [Gemmatimonadales bacterium]|jgi:flagellar biosynthetic protein FliQ